MGLESPPTAGEGTAYLRFRSAAMVGVAQLTGTRTPKLPLIFGFLERFRAGRTSAAILVPGCNPSAKETFERKAGGNIRDIDPWCSDLQPKSGERDPHPGPRTVAGLSNA
jgi:hypothetical protein